MEAPAAVVPKKPMVAFQRANRQRSSKKLKPLGAAAAANTSGASQDPSAPSTGGGDSSGASHGPSKDAKGPSGPTGAPGASHGKPEEKPGERAEAAKASGARPVSRLKKLLQDGAARRVKKKRPLPGSQHQQQQQQTAAPRPVMPWTGAYAGTHTEKGGVGKKQRLVETEACLRVNKEKIGVENEWKAQRDAVLKK